MDGTVDSGRTPYATSGSEQSESAIANLARRAEQLASSFDARDPQSSLKQLGIALVPRMRPLHALKLRARRASGGRLQKRVHGAWDPMLRRIELFGCDSSRPDFDVVRTLGHEIGHAITPDARSNHSETIAHAFADAWLSELGPVRVKACAAALRASAIEHSNAQQSASVSSRPGEVTTSTVNIGL